MNVTKTKIENNQACIVFFETREELNKYLNSPNYLIKARHEYLVIEDNIDLKIKQATLAKNITLLVKDFGRGTDFVCFDEKVQENGGVAIIQTFFSEEIEEEIQIKGRTKRYGQCG